MFFVCFSSSGLESLYHLTGNPLLQRPQRSGGLPQRGPVGEGVRVLKTGRPSGQCAGEVQWWKTGRYK